MREARKCGSPSVYELISAFFDRAPTNANPTSPAEAAAVYAGRIRDHASHPAAGPGAGCSPAAAPADVPDAPAAPAAAARRQDSAAAARCSSPAGDCTSGVRRRDRSAFPPRQMGWSPCADRQFRGGSDLGLQADFGQTAPELAAEPARCAGRQVRGRCDLGLPAGSVRTALELAAEPA